MFHSGFSSCSFHQLFCECLSFYGDQLLMELGIGNNCLEVLSGFLHFVYLIMLWLFLSEQTAGLFWAIC